MSGNSLNPRLALYFQSGQVMFHGIGSATEDSIQILIEEANKLAETEGLKIEPSTSRTQHFPPVESYNNQQSRTESAGDKRPPFSLIYADVTKDGKKLGDQQDELQLLLDLIFLLDDELAKPSNELLQVVSPNWLMSGSPSDPGGTGGPGGRPTPYVGISNNTEHKFNISQSFPRQYLDYMKPGCDEPVVVAILDTAPDSGKLDGIYNEWGVNKNHPLIHEMLDPEKRLLNVHNDPRLSAPPISELTYLDHDYEMTDHGLFIAGIIHSLAPNAELHLFQVLNRYGVGDLETIGETLAKVFNQFDSNRLIVNLSLNYSIPLERAHTKLDKAHTKLGKELKHDVLGQAFLDAKHASWLKRALKPAEWMYDLFYDRKSGIIAAAGNDYDDQEPGTPRPQARYPAAFDNVVGVGALARSKKGMPGKAASYSNLADRPPRDGITTLGGEEGVQNGILGTFIGKFPDGSPNDSGWAWWCGTSFATPIISGIVAAILSCMLSENQQATTQDAIKVVFEAQKKTTKQSEDIFMVTQGVIPP